MRNDLNLPISLLADSDLIGQVAGAAINLNAVVQELLERGQIENLFVTFGPFWPFLAAERFCENKYVLAYCSQGQAILVYHAMKCGRGGA
jgi:hypothetical protein